MGSSQGRVEVVRRRGIGLGLSCWLVSGPALWAMPAQAQAEPWVIFVNFDGATIGRCDDPNATEPQNDCGSRRGLTVFPYGGSSASRATIVQVIRTYVADFNIRVTDQRPKSGDYDMEMVGDLDRPPGGSIAGFSPNVDCDNQAGGDISFTFEHVGGAPDGAGSNEIGIGHVALQELAHSWGLEHVNRATDLLYPTYSGRPAVFQDECFDVVSDTDLKPETSPECWEAHQASCGAATKQNSHKELLTIFGPRAYEPGPPTVDIKAPVMDAKVASNFDLVLELFDESTPQLFQLQVALDDLKPSLGRYADRHLTFPIRGLPPGPHVVRLRVENEAGLAATDEVAFVVTDGAEPPSTGDGEDTAVSTGGVTTDTGDETMAPGTETAASGATDETGPGTGAEAGGEGREPAAAEGCACGVGTDVVPRAGALLIFGVVGLSRRRRDSRCNQLPRQRSAPSRVPGRA